MKNKASVTAGVRVAIASSILAFACASASAAELTGTNNLAAEFQAVAHSDLLMLGPVDAVDQAKGRAQVLGQWIQLSPSQATQELVGRVLAVYGSVSADGSLEVAAAREQNSVEYVPGATRVYLKGSLTEIDSLHGAARIGSLSVSYSNALHTLAAEDLAVGSVVSFAGLRYTDGNKMYADSGLVHRTAGAVQTLGQTGSGFKGARSDRQWNERARSNWQWIPHVGPNWKWLSNAGSNGKWISNARPDRQWNERARSNWQRHACPWPDRQWISNAGPNGKWLEDVRSDW